MEDALYPRWGKLLAASGEAGLRGQRHHELSGSDLLYVFSTSTIFEAGRAYSKFAAYAILEHGGEFRAAARALAAREETRDNTSDAVR